MAEEELMTIGEITRHQGNKGEVRVRPLTDFLERFEDLEKVYLAAGREKKEVEVESFRYHKGFIILKFFGFDNIEEAINHKGYEVKIPKEEAVELPEDSYFLYQIVGLEVYTEKNEYLGVVEEIIETGANDVYKIKDKNEKILIPALKEVVKEVNLKEGKLKVDLPPGLR